MKHCAICKSKYDDNVSFCPVDGEVLEKDPASIVDTVLDGQYQMESMLGKGGMGAVYRARHILLGDRVAIKVLPPEVRNNAEWLRRFRREGQAARRFRHPNAVTVYDLRTAGDGTIYMVMEYVEGHTLDAEIKKRGRLSAKEAFELLTPIMSVLDTAHSMGVVHRDLKPENIMVGKPGSDGVPVIKLLDLGIAKISDIAGVDTAGNTALTMAGQVLGTPYYMSPEQWGEIPRDGSVEIDGRADIYSLGLVFYEMIAGRRCYSSTTLHELRRDHVGTRPTPLREVAPDVPIGFSEAIARATAKDRADRQRTASQLAAELKAGLQTASTGPSATPGSLSATVAVPGSRETNSDVNAPTVMTVAAMPTIAPPLGTNPPGAVNTGTPPPIVVTPLPDNGLSSPTIAASAATASSVTAPQVPICQPLAPVKSKAGLFIGLGVGLVLLLVLGVGGLLAWNWSKSRTGESTTGNDKAPAETVVAPLDVGSYWLELEAANKGEKPTRVAPLVPIASGQSLKMHFTFDEDGYVYLVGPGPDANQPTAFLTSKPAPESNLKTNEVKRGVDFTFPAGEAWLTLDKNPGSENYTVIFSTSKLTEPAFLNAPVNIKALTSAEQSDWSEFVTKYQAKPPKTEVDGSNRDGPSVRVKVAPSETGNPIIFDIRIQHN
jgi:serine/threonine-protein kinase